MIKSVDIHKSGAHVVNNGARIERLIFAALFRILICDCIYE